MANAAALLMGLALIWLGWTGALLDPYWLSAGVIALLVAGAIALLMRGIDSAAAPYIRGPLGLMHAPSAVRRALVSGFDIARRSLAGDPLLNPALMRVKTRDDARAALAGAVGRAPGTVVVDAEEDSLLLHVALETNEHEAALHAIERRVGGRE